ncbi:Integrator complex subunit 10 [Anabarilius grahami]|uniref:Integrator complex subunit 10 n=1 Tax=Anabarilius grahami TaxID=495550 RepID=A0A3N0Y4L9_ANAGA|nr:Integrator complex subunit 10 [Anabarilius grahami]
MSAQGDCEFLVKRARELVPQDPYAAKAWLITARTLYPTDFNIQYEMYSIERNAERTASAGRLLYDIFVNFPEQPVVWREIAVITAALRNDSQDKHAQFLKGVFETLPGPVQCKMLLKATEQCFNTLEKAEMLLLLLKRFPESVVQHGVSLGESLLEAETVEDLDTPVNCFRKLFVCDVLPLILNNPEMCLPVSLLYKYMHKAAEFYICYVTREPSADGQMQGSQEVGGLKSPGRGRGQRYVINGLSEKSSVVTEPWERLLEMVGVVGSLCDWQGEKGSRSYSELLQRITELCRYMSAADGEGFARCCGQIVTCCTLVLFHSAFHYVSAVQPSLFQEMPRADVVAGHASLSSCPWVLLEDLSSVYTDVEVERKHAHKKRKLADGREKTMGQYRKALSSLALMSSLQLQQNQNQNSLSTSSTLETHRAIIQQASCHYALGEYRMACEKLLEVVAGLTPQNQEAVKSSEEQRKPRCKTRKGNDLRLVPCTSKSILPFCLQLMLACFKLRAFTDNRDDLALGHVIVLLQHDWPQGNDLRLVPCTSKSILPFCLQLMLACFKLRAFTDNRDDLALGHVIVLLQLDWPQGENLFLKAVDKICQQGSFQYENFFNYVTNIDMLEEFAYLRTTEGGRVQLELLPNQGMLIKNPSPALGVELNTLLLPGAQKADRHHTVTRGITKGVKEDFRLAMERQVSRCGENLLTVLHRFCINEKIILIQSLP